MRVVERTGPTPGLPYVTALGHDPGAIFRAVSRAIRRLRLTDRRALGVHGLVAIPASDYLAVTP